MEKEMIFQDAVGYERDMEVFGPPRWTKDSDVFDEIKEDAMTDEKFIATYSSAYGKEMTLEIERKNQQIRRERDMMFDVLVQQAKEHTEFCLAKLAKLKEIQNGTKG